jgi:hypothetical protein
VHIEALHRLGPTSEHRRSWRNVPQIPAGADDTVIDPDALTDGDPMAARARSAT